MDTSEAQVSCHLWLGSVLSGKPRPIRKAAGLWPPRGLVGTAGFCAGRQTHLDSPVHHQDACKACHALHTAPFKGTTFLPTYRAAELSKGFHGKLVVKPTPTTKPKRAKFWALRSKPFLCLLPLLPEPDQEAASASQTCPPASPVLLMEPHKLHGSRGHQASLTEQELLGEGIPGTVSMAMITCSYCTEGIFF